MLKISQLLDYVNVGLFNNCHAIQDSFVDVNKDMTIPSTVGHVAYT